MSMRLGIVAEFTDNATKRMKKLLRFNERMEKLNKTQAKLQTTSSRAQSKAAQSTAKTATQTEKLARAQSRVKAGAQQAFNTVVKGAQNAGRSIAKLHRQSLDLAKNGLGNIKNGLGKVGKGAMIATGVLASMWAGSALAAGSMVDVASQFEKFETVLISSTGSAEGAKAAMGWVTNFAVTTPYELDQVTEAFVQLKNYGIDPTNGTLRTLGDTSAAMGKPLTQAVEALADAVTGENERLKEFGITAKKSGDMITYAYTDAAGKAMTATAKASDRASIQMTLMDIFNEKYAGSMERLAGTWSGMMSNLADLWMKFQLMIMDAGLFDWMKGKLRLVLDTISQMEADGSLKAWATEIATAIQTSLESAWDFATKAIDVISQLSDHLGSAAEFVGGWENLAMVLGGMVFGPALVATAAGLIQIATGLAALGAALIANPIMLAIAAIALGVYLIYANWDAIKPYFEAIWNGILHAAQVAWDWLKQAFEWTPLGQIVKNWEPIAQALSGPIDAGKAAVSSIWEAIKSLFSWNPAHALSSLWSGIAEAMAGPIEAGKTTISNVWETIKALFAWTPLGIIATNWDKISAALSNPIEAAKSVLSSTWEGIKSIFELDWSTLLPPFSFPAIDSTSVEVAFNAVIKFVEDGWGKLKPIFDTILGAAADLGQKIGATITAAVDGAKAALSALQGAKGADRFIDQLNQIAGHGVDGQIWGTRDGFQKGQALTEGLAAGTVTMQTYREELQKVIEASGKYSSVATNMLDASKQLDAFSTPEQLSSPAVDTATQQVELDKLRKSSEALPTLVQTSLNNINAMLASTNFAHHGERMMETIAAGMRAKSHLLVSAMRDVTKQLRDHLPSSPAKTGPLSDIHRLKFSETIARSIKPGPMVKAMRQAAAATMAAASISAPALASAPTLVSPPQSVAARPSSQTQANGASKGASYSFTLAPVINVGEGSTASAEDIVDKLSEIMPDLIEKIKRELKDDERLEF